MVAATIVIILCGIIGALIGLISKPEEEGEERDKYLNIRVFKPGQVESALGGGTEGLWGKMQSAMIAGAVVGAIAGVLLSIFSIVALGFNGLLGTAIMLLSGAVVGAIAFMLFILLKSVIVQILGPRVSKMIAGLIVGIVVGLLINLLIMPAGGSAALEYWKIGLQPVGKTLGGGLQELSKWQYCFQADPRCPFWIDWSDPNIQNAQETLGVSVNFKNNQIKQDQVKLDAIITVNNPEVNELHLVPKCYIGSNFGKAREMRIENMGQYAAGSEFIFGMSSENQRTSLMCVSDVPECATLNVCSINAYLVLERPVLLSGVWPIYIGGSSHYIGQKQVKTSLANNVPYSIALYSPNDMPFDMDTPGGFRFYVSLKQRDEETTLKDIELIRIIFPEGVMAGCEKGFTAEGSDLIIRNINETWLKDNLAYDSVEKEYTFPCTLYVTKAPKIAEEAPIQIESSYTVISKFTTLVTKQIA
jgi:hypothetical protein